MTGKLQQEATAHLERQHRASIRRRRSSGAARIHDHNPGLEQGIFEPDEPLVHAWQGLELQGMVHLDLSNLKDRIRKERARREYVPWFVQGKLPEDVDSELAAARTSRAPAPQLTVNAAPASPQPQLPIGKGLHAALLYAVGKTAGTTASGSKPAAGAITAMATASAPVTPGRGYNPQKFVEVAAAHAAGVAYSAKQDPSHRGMSRAARLALKSLHKQLAETSTSTVATPNEAATAPPGLPGTRPFAMTAPPKPLSTSEAKHRWGTPVVGAQSPRDQAFTPATAWRTWAPPAPLRVPDSPTSCVGGAQPNAMRPVSHSLGGAPGSISPTQRHRTQAAKPRQGSLSPSKKVDPQTMKAATKLLHRMDEEWSAIADSDEDVHTDAPRPGESRPTSPSWQSSPHAQQQGTVFSRAQSSTHRSSALPKRQDSSGTSVLAEVMASRAAATRQGISTAPSRISMSRAALLASRQGGSTVCTGRDLVLLRAHERAHRFISLEPGHAGPVLLEDWRTAVLHHPSASRPHKLRSAVRQANTTQALHDKQHLAARQALSARVSQLGAALWAKLRALGPHRILMAMLPTDAAQSYGLSMIQTLQANSGLAGQVKQRVRAFERVVPSPLQLVSSSQPSPDVPTLPSPLDTPRDPVLPDNPLQGDQQEGPSADAAAFTGAYGSPTALRARLRAENQALITANPAAFNEEIALQADAEHRAASERAALRLAKAQDPVEVAQHSERRLLGALQSAVHELHAARPFFHSPVPSKPKVQRAEVEKAAAAEVVKEPWQLEKSIFALRKKECEARDFYDNDKVKLAQFQLDWSRVVCKVRFRKLVAREDKAVSSSDEHLEEELLEIRQELEHHKDIVRSVFNYYSMMNGSISQSSVLTMGLNQWLNFCTEVQLIMSATGKRGATSGDLQTIFVAVNFEEESETQESQANDDDAMMRFEFLEGLVRAAIGRFIVTKQCDDASDAVHMLLNTIIVPSAPPEALLDPNDFRRERFYCEAMDLSIQAHMDMLQACFKVYKAQSRSKYMNIENWAAFADAAGLLGKHTGVENRELKLVFVYSQMIVSDELKRRKRATSLMFFDYLEALSRLSDLISPPPIEDVKTWLFEHHPEVALPASDALLLSEYYQLLKASGDGEAQKRASAELTAPPTRPLVEKFESVMGVVVVRMMAVWGGHNEQDCAARMRKAATQISGGVELG